MIFHFNEILLRVSTSEVIKQALYFGFYIMDNVNYHAVT